LQPVIHIHKHSLAKSVAYLHGLAQWAWYT
jgi:hypothetical protein